MKKRRGRPPVENPVQRVVTLYAPVAVQQAYRTAPVEVQEAARRAALAALVAALEGAE